MAVAKRRPSRISSSCFVSIALLEMSGSPAGRLHLMLGALLLARILHPFGMSAALRTWRFRVFRTGGVSLTFLVLVSSAVALLVRFVVRA